MKLAIIAVLLSSLFILAGFYGIRKQELIECQMWKQYEEDYRAIYYTTDWQKKQCEQFGIKFVK